MSVTITNSELEFLAPIFVEALAETLEPLAAFSLKVETEAKELNDVSKVPVYSPMDPAVTFVEGSQNYETEQASGVAFKNVELTEHKKHTISLTDLKRRGISKEELMKGQAQAFGKTVLLDVYATILAATYTNSIVVGLATAYDSDLFADFWTQMDLLNWPDEGRIAIAKTTYMGNLLKDNDLKNADAAGDTGLLRKATFSDLYDIRPIKSQVIPDNAENMVGLLGNGRGVGVGMAPVIVDDGDGAEGIVSSFLVSAPGGLTIGFRTHYDPANGKRWQSVELLYGIDELQPESIIRLTSV